MVFDQDCVFLDIVHGNVTKMDCLRDGSDEVYRGTLNPWLLSGRYKLYFEDGAVVEIGSIYGAALCHGSFWFGRDSTNKIDSVFVREDRVLAYMAQRGANLERDKAGEVTLPSAKEAEKILADLDVPFEPIVAGCQYAMDKAKRWTEDWKQRGLIKWDDFYNVWKMTNLEGAIDE